jgi:YgiT-type zinc finger domain-containing protein
MKCVFCRHGDTKPGFATFTAEKNNTIVVIRKVPALICENCGEEYFNEDTTDRILKQIDESAGAGVQVEIREYSDKVVVPA